MDLKAAPSASRLSRLALRTQPDERLVKLAREGQIPAYEEIVRRYRAPLVRFAATIVPPHQAEDAVQEALIRAHKALLADDSELQLRAWLYTIVRNGAVSERRKIRPTEQLDETINGVPRPPDIYERNETVRGVIAKIKVLPDAQREALVRTELGGESAEEIATALGTTTGSVGQLVFRARAALRSGAAVVLPMPVLRFLLATPAGGEAGATATGGLLAGALTSGGGSIAVKVGAAIVVAAIAVGPGQAPIGGGKDGGGDDALQIGGIGGGSPDAEEPGTENAQVATHESATHESSTTGEGDVGSPASGEGSASTRGGSSDGAQSGQPGDSESFDGGQVGSEPEHGSGGGGSGNGGGAKPAPPPPTSDGGHHDDGGGQTTDAGGQKPPPPPPTNDYDGGYDSSGGNYGGGGNHNDYNHSYNDPDDGVYPASDDGGGGDYGGNHNGHP